MSMINWGHSEKKCPHRGWSSIKVTTQLRTLENSWEHQKTSKIIWYHTENNWGPIIDNLVQFEEDFNSRTKKWVRSGPVGLSQTRPIPRSPDGDKKKTIRFQKALIKSTVQQITDFVITWIDHGKCQDEAAVAMTLHPAAPSAEHPFNLSVCRFGVFFTLCLC